MSRPGELSVLLRAAFPRDDHNVSCCSWCGAFRIARHALCKSCWSGIGRDHRALYMALRSLEARAHWILDNAPGVRS
jgi:hypothetical protein